MDLNECISKIDSLIQEIEEIIQKGAKVEDSLIVDKYRDLCILLGQYMRTFFNDAENRLKDYYDSLDIAVKRDNWKETGIFLEQAKVTKRYLVSIKESLKLRMTTKIEDNNLDILGSKIKEKSLEADRRGAVVETKVYGAAIEIIDKLRGELKSNQGILDELNNLRRDMNEVKENVSILLKGVLGKD